MSKPGRYLLTGMLAVMLAIAPLSTVMALSAPIKDLCASMTDHGGELQQTGQTSTASDSGHSNQANGQGCCNDNESNCVSHCTACTNVPYATVTTPQMKIVRQHLSITSFIAGAVPLLDLSPLLRPPVTLHS